MQPSLIRLLRWLDSRSTLSVATVITLVAVVAFVYAEEIKRTGFGHGLVESDCLTKAEMTRFIRRHHASEHLSESGLRSLSARLGLLPPDLDIEVDWEFLGNKPDASILSRPADRKD